LGILTPKTLCLTPHNMFNFANVASFSLTSTSKKLANVDGPLTFFFQHLSFVPKQKKHFKPQFFVLCPPPHLVHFGLKWMSLKHAKGVCSFDLHN
jgi:hypothetical protein